MKTVYNSYDAYGVASTLYYNGGSNTRAFYNPFRYRGYYYDHGIGLYFLKTRYYDPEIGRFITIDDITYLLPDTINGLNLYAYCGNNPVMHIDPFGTETFSISFGYFLGIFGGGYSGSFGISVDSNGMVAFQFTYSVPNDEHTRNTVFGATAGISANVQWTKLESVTYLEKEAKLVGVNSVIGADVVLNKENEIIGISAGIGPSVGADIHINQTYTYTIGNPFRSVFKIIKDWLFSL